MGRKKEEQTKLYAMEVANPLRLAFPKEKRRSRGSHRDVVYLG
jgi:hypothetical protein